MRVYRSIILIIGFILMAAIGFKIAKKIYRHFNKPKLFDTREIILKIPSVGRGLKIFVASSLDRIFLNGKTLSRPSFSTSASISSARNAYESFQVVVDTPFQDQPGVYLQLSDLVNSKTGRKISRDNFSWRRVGYVQTLEPYYPVKFVGFWPDPLIPVKSYDIKAGTIQPFWLTVYIPKDTPEGDYAAAVIVKGLNFAAQTLQVKLHVYHFTLPQENHLKTAFDFYGHEIPLRYPQGDGESAETWNARLDDINDKFIIDMLKHRMNPILNIDPSSASELSDVDRYRVYGLNNFAIGKHGGTFDNNWPKDDPSIEELLTTYQTYGEDLKLNHLLEYAYIYTWDEGEIGNPLVPKIASMLHRAYPGLKNMVCYHGFWDPDQDPAWGRDIDIWTFQIDDFNEKKMRKLQKMGKEIWMYVSGPSGTSSPNLALDFDSIDYRIIPWICWKYDIRGFLYWCVNWWPNVDPFKNARNSQWEQNGNGLLFYPGPDSPWDSIRVENFRDGMQDYEYIQILLDRLRLLRSKGLEQKYKKDFGRGIKLLTMDDSIVKSMGEFTSNGDYLKVRRDAIAMEIEKIDALTGVP